MIFWFKLGFFHMTKRFWKYNCNIYLTKRCQGQRWIKLSGALRDRAESKVSAVPDSAESSWILSETALRQAEFYLRQRWVKLNFIRDSVESSWILSETALCQAEFYLRQRWVKQKAMGFLNRQLLSKKITYPGQRCVKLSAVLNITESSLWLSRIAPSHILWSKNNTYLDGVYFLNTYYYKMVVR